MKLTKDNIPKYTGRGDWTDTVKCGAYSVRVKCSRDDMMGEPWKEHDGHGPVSDWRAKDSKRAGERILCEDRGMARFYDFAAAVKLAKADGWDALPYKTGTAGERAVRAVEKDMQYLADWCADRWCWVYVVAEVSRNGAVIGQESCGGIESEGDYWREMAAELAQGLIDADKAERRERNYWNARDVMTVGAHT